MKKSRTLILILIVSFACVDLYADEKEKYFCMSAKTKYEKCQAEGNKECAAQNEKIFNSSLNCSKILSGQKLKKSNNDFQSEQFKWTSQCQDIVSDHRRCSRGGDEDCANKLKLRHSTLKCASGLNIYLNP